MKYPIPFSEREVLVLLFLINKIGTQWNKIEKYYRSYFQNRKSWDLSSKYFKLKKNRDNYENLMNRAKLINDIEILEINQKPNNIIFSDSEVIIF
jgi:hypothetical protein